MAKRKAARAAGGKKKAAKRSRGSRASSAARKGAARRSPARAGGRTGAAKKAARKRSPVASKASRKGASATKKRAATKKVVARKVPALDRARRIVRDEDIVPTPPSSLNLDRSASAVRTGRHELSEKMNKHTETSPAMTAGDVDADWESAYSVGDEAPGGDNPTPDQDIVDDIGRAVGVQYEDNEELKGEKKISDRDRKRWELDPASSEDYEDR
jgi:hypothetical protein